MASDKELADFLAGVERRAFKQTVYAVRDDDASLDIVQDAMIKLAEKYGDRPPAELPLLFQRILQNATHDYFRRQKVRNTWVSLFSSLTNADDTVHFMQLQPVGPGTTDRDVQRALEATGGLSVGGLADTTRPTVGSEVLSPGVRHAVDYDLPAGRYVLLCFIADESDGMTHAVMGMHEVIVLR